jgi:hypothetical protein
MIDNSVLPSRNEIYRRIGERAPRLNRGRCPIHDGDSLYSVALDEDKGVFYCHVCHASGDKISFIQQVYRCHFKEALAFYGLQPGKIPMPDPEVERRRRIRQGLQNWANIRAWQLREDHFIRCVVETAAKRLLHIDPDHMQAWNALAWALTKIEAVAYELDMLAGSDAEKIEAYKFWRNAA